MKKEFILLFVLLFSLTFLSSAEIILEKSSYFKGQTLQGEIKGGFIDNILKDNIKIYSENASHPIPAEIWITKYKTSYLFYATLPYETGKYYVQVRHSLLHWFRRD